MERKMKERRRWGVEREEAGMAVFNEQLCACNPNQWVISTSLATNIYLKLLTEGRAV